MSWVERYRFDIGLEDLQTFIAVAELGSFSKAAEQLNLSQPSISNRVRRLEEKLFVRLLDRTTRRVGLTPEGQLLLTQASSALRGLRSLLQDFNRENSARDRQVKIAATLMVATVGLPPILRRFHDDHPSITVLLHDLAPTEALDHVADGRCDFALMAMLDQRPGLAFEPLVSDRCVVVTPLGHPLLEHGAAPFAEVLQHPLLSPNGHAGLRHAIVAEADRRGLSIRLSAEAKGVNNVITLLAMAAAGLGVCIHPSSFVPVELQPTIGVVPIADCDIIRTFGIVTAENRPLSAVAQKFSDFLRLVSAQSPWLRRGLSEDGPGQRARRSDGDGRSPANGRDNPSVSRSVVPE